MQCGRAPTDNIMNANMPGGEPMAPCLFTQTSRHDFLTASHCLPRSAGQYGERSAVIDWTMHERYRVDAAWPLRSICPRKARRSP